MNTKKIHVGNLTAKAGKVYEYDEITGWLDAGNADKAAFPQLASIGGYLDCSGADTKAAFPKLASIGNSLYCSGADTKAAFPKLASIGGYLDCSGATGDLSHVKTNDETAAQKCRKQLFETNRRNGFHFADGILAKIISKRGNVYKVVICGKREKSFVIASGDGNYSHGATIKEARDSLIYKLQSRDLTEFEGWTLKTCVSLAGAVKAYRSITGACEAGVRGFCEQHGKMPAKLTVEEIVEMTKGKYGNEQFAKFFEGKQ